MYCSYFFYENGFYVYGKDKIGKISEIKLFKILFCSDFISSFVTFTQRYVAQRIFFFDVILAIITVISNLYARIIFRHKWVENFASNYRKIYSKITRSQTL